MVLQAGDCARQSLIASLSLGACALLAACGLCKAHAHPPERGSYPTPSSVDSSQVRSQVTARDTTYRMSRTMISSLLAYTSRRTLSTFFSTFYLEPHCICVLCWDEIAIVWHPIAYIRHSFAMNFKKMSLAVGQHAQ